MKCTYICVYKKINEILTNLLFSIVLLLKTRLLGAVCVTRRSDEDKEINPVATALVSHPKQESLLKMADQ